MGALSNSNVSIQMWRWSFFRNILYLPYQGDVFNIHRYFNIQGIIDGGR
jgi:hypothetical protein